MTWDAYWVTKTHWTSCSTGIKCLNLHRFVHSLIYEICSCKWSFAAFKNQDFACRVMLQKCWQWEYVMEIVQYNIPSSCLKFDTLLCTWGVMQSTSLMTVDISNVVRSPLQAKTQEQWKSLGLEKATLKAKRDFVVEGTEEVWLFPKQEDKTAKRREKKKKCMFSGVKTK